MRTAGLWIAVTLVMVMGCRGDKPKPGLPPAKDWHGVDTGGATNTGSGSARPPAGDDAERFTACLFDQLAVDPLGSANALSIFARAAPAADARRVIGAIADQADRFPPGAQAKILGEAAWALADAGDLDAARKAATRGAELPPDGEGGRLTALAVLGRIGPVADAAARATDMMTRDVVAFGAAVGGHRDEAAQLRAQIEADPAAALFVGSAIHLKLVAALGDVAAIKRALADRGAPQLLLDAGAVVEGGAHVGNEAVMMAGVAALTEARGVSPSSQALALIGAAGTAANAPSLPVTDAAVAAFDALPLTARAGLELAPAASYVNAGALDKARARLAAHGGSATAEDRMMFAAGIAAAAGAWNELPEQLPPVPVLNADIWGRALAAKLDATTRARVLDAICPR